MDTQQNFSNLTAESFWAETREQMKETDRRMQETDRRMQETDRKMQDTDRRMKKLQELMGLWANNHGSFAEEYFFNAFENGKQDFFGETFFEISKNLKPKKGKLEEEFDIVLFNGNSAAIVEVKYKAHENDVPKVVDKAKTFRILLPDYADFKIYLGLASFIFYPELEQACTNAGIAIIKQVGDSVVIYDEHLKIF
jgi:hypothetical protein